MSAGTPSQDYLNFEAAMKARDPKWFQGTPAAIGYMAWCAAQPAASSAQSSKPEPQSSRVGVLDKAASSAQEPLNSDTLWEMAKAECRAVECGHQRFGEGMHFPDRAALLRFAALVIDRTDAERAASPARLAGAAQGEAAQEAADQMLDDAHAAYAALKAIADRQRQIVDVIEPVGSIGAASRLAANAVPRAKRLVDALYSHPQAQAERRPTLSQFTPRQRKRLWENSPEHHKDAASFAGFERIVSLTERAHGIPTASTASDEGSA